MLLIWKEEHGEGRKEEFPLEIRNFPGSYEVRRRNRGREKGRVGRRNVGKEERGSVFPRS